MQSLNSRFARAAKCGAAAFCLSIFLFVQLMAIVPSFHTLVHPDANTPMHDCAATLLLHGHVHTPSADVAVAQPPTPFILEAPARVVSFLSADFRLLPGRDPPV